MRLKADAAFCFINDTHVGGITGLCPPQGFLLKTGSRITPSFLQQKSVDHWQGFWKRRKKDNCEIVLFLGGDMVEGAHHQSTETSGNVKAQIDNALEVLRAPANMAKYIFSVSGTPVHVGPEGSADDIIAKEIGATPVYGLRSNYHIRVETFGVKVDFAHHGPSRGRREWNRENQLRLYAKSILMQNVAAGRDTPDLIVRCHRHKKLECFVEYEERRAWAFLSPSWQWRTEYGHMVSSEEHLADIGALVVYVRKGKIVGHIFDCITVEDVPLVKYE